MIGPGSGLPPAAGGLSDLTALLELINNPQAYEAKLGELASREAALDARKAELDEQKAELGRKQKELARHEASLLERVTKEANARADDRVKYKERTLNEALAQLHEKASALAGALEAFQAKSESFQAKAGEAETAVARFLKIAA